MKHKFSIGALLGILIIANIIFFINWPGGQDENTQQNNAHNMFEFIKTPDDLVSFLEEKIETENKELTQKTIANFKFSASKEIRIKQVDSLLDEYDSFVKEYIVAIKSNDHFLDSMDYLNEEWLSIFSTDDIQEVTTVLKWSEIKLAIDLARSETF